MRRTAATSRIVRRKRIRGLLGLAAAATLAMAPVTASASPGYMISICTAEGARLVALEDLPLRPADRRDERMANLCAHATCPRELRLDRKARGCP